MRKTRTEKNKFATRYFKDGKLHRVGAPAVKHLCGDKLWFQNGKCHRADGPAIEMASGSRFWYKNDKLHRLDGPAEEYPDGSKYYYIDDVEYDKEEDFREMVLILKLSGLEK